MVPVSTVSSAGAHAELAPEKHEAAEEDEPDVAEEEAREHEDDGEPDVETEGRIDGAENGSGRGWTRAEDAARGKSGDGQQIDGADEELNPDGAAQHVMEG